MVDAGVPPAEGVGIEPEIDLRKEAAELKDEIVRLLKDVK